MASSLNLTTLSLNLRFCHSSNSSSRLSHGSVQLPRFNKGGKALRLSSTQNISAFSSLASYKPQILQSLTLFATKGYKMKTHKTSFLGVSQSLSQRQSLSLGPPYPPCPSSPSPLFYVQAKARTRIEDRHARHSRIRKKVEGTPDRPRLCVFRSNKHLYVQVIDDSKMHTLASASTMQKPICEDFNYSSGPTVEVAKKIGEFIAKSCLEQGITKVAFDRGGYPYHGRIEAIADSAREHGLQF